MFLEEISPAVHNIRRESDEDYIREDEKDRIGDNRNRRIMRL